MQSDNKILSDLARLGQSAAGTIHGVKSEVESQVKSRLESVLMDMNLVLVKVLLLNLKLI